MGVAGIGPAKTVLIMMLMVSTAGGGKGDVGRRGRGVASAEAREEVRTHRENLIWFFGQDHER